MWESMQELQGWICIRVREDYTSPLAHLGALLAACHVLEGVRAQLPFSSSFSWFLPEETMQKGIEVQGLKFFTCMAESNRSPRVKFFYMHGRVQNCSTWKKHVFPGKLKVVRTAKKSCIKAWNQLCYILNIYKILLVCHLHSSFFVLISGHFK